MSGGWTFSPVLGVEHDEAHVTEALADRLFQDEELPRLEAYLRVLAARWQVVEDLLWQLATERNLDDAVGVQLDGLGDLLDEPRGGLTDTQYRPFLRAKVLVLRSRGRVEELIQILTVLGYIEIAVREQPPAHLQVEVCDVTLARETDRLLRLAKAGGVGLLFVYSALDADHTFQASRTYATAEYDADTGAGSVYDATVGGQSAGGFR
jgi:hypothetical protein